MKDYLKIISDLLLSGKKVIVCSVGGDTLNILRGLKIKFNILPTALCDNDTNKQGKNFRGVYDLEILSVTKAKELFPDAYWFVSTLDYKYQIIGQLKYSMDIPESRIINYEPVIKQNSCDYLEKSMVCDEYRRFSYCWYQPQSLPAIPFNGSYNESLKAFRELRDNTLNNYCGQCGNCCFYKHDYYPSERKIRWINYGIGGICNFDCMYCKSNAHYAKTIDPDAPQLDRIIESLNCNNMLADDYGINIAPGEPTIHPNKESIFGSMNCYSNVVNTNLNIFNEQLYDLMKNRFTKLVVSIDSGTKETFKKVKGRDRLNIICDHLNQYSSAGFGIIVLKYVFIPGANDSFEDVDGFADIAEKTGCLIGNISYDYGSPLPIPEQTALAMKRLKNNLSERKIICTQNIVYSQSDYVSELKKSISDLSVVS